MVAFRTSLKSLGDDDLKAFERITAQFSQIDPLNSLILKV